MLTEEEFNKEIFDRMMLVEEFVQFNLRSSSEKENIDLWIMALLNYCFLRISNTEGSDASSFKKMVLEAMRDGCNKLEKEIGN